MRIRVVTLFPELFETPLKTGLVGRAIERGDVDVAFTNPRDFAEDRHRTVDDQPYGGGGGMVLRVEPWAAAIEAEDTDDGPVVLLTPQGAPLEQAHLARWADAESLTLVAGRYEGFDERLRTLVTEEVSLGDFVLTGGEPAALAIIDGVVRLRPGTLGNAESPHVDSFGAGLSGLLEYPQYTRPPSWRGLDVPEVLRSGDHARIEAWRRSEALGRTLARRPDRLLRAELPPSDRFELAARRTAAPRPLLVAPAELPLELLWAAACAYALDVEVVAGADADAVRVAIEGLPGQREPLPPTRARRRRDPAPPELRAADRMHAVAAATPPAPGQRVLGLAPEVDVERPQWRAGSLRGPKAPVLVLGTALDPERWTAVVPPPRPCAPGGGLSWSWRLPILLERVFGEG